MLTKLFQIDKKFAFNLFHISNHDRISKIETISDDPDPLKKRPSLQERLWVWTGFERNNSYRDFSLYWGNNLLIALLKKCWNLECLFALVFPYFNLNINFSKVKVFFASQKNFSKTREGRVRHKIIPEFSQIFKRATLQKRVFASNNFNLSEEKLSSLISTTSNWRALNAQKLIQ